MEAEDIKRIVDEQRRYFLKGVTRNVDFRKGMLKKLYQAIKDDRKELAAAMKKDFNKNGMEVYMTETGLVLGEITFHLRHIDRWTRDRHRPTPLAQFWSRSYIKAVPYGVALIMSPWNYPIQLSLDPLVGAISAGCTAVLKPSAYAPATSRALAGLISRTFPPEYIAVIEGGRQENKSLLDQKFDYIFFTGSPAVGRFVMERASVNLTPVTLELGGKSPVIVDETANIKVAARRIAFGKVLNAGQTCVEPDYLLIHKDVKEAFVRAYKEALDEFFPLERDREDMCVIVNRKHFDRVAGYLEGAHIVLGGGTDPARRYVEPTLIDDVAIDSPVMTEEIFAPILPMLPYTSLDTCIDFINSRPRPLALYMFTENKAAARRVLSNTVFGGGCINDTIIHLATSRMPFGGVGDSGMGGYHGKYSFDTFTHYTSIVDKTTRLDLPVRYRPYTKLHKKAVELLVK